MRAGELTQVLATGHGLRPPLRLQYGQLEDPQIYLADDMLIRLDLTSSILCHIGYGPLVIETAMCACRKEMAVGSDEAQTQKAHILACPNGPWPKPLLRWMCVVVNGQLYLCVHMTGLSPRFV